MVCIRCHNTNNNKLTFGICAKSYGSRSVCLPVTALAATYRNLQNFVVKNFCLVQNGENSYFFLVILYMANIWQAILKEQKYCYMIISETKILHMKLM